MHTITESRAIRELLRTLEHMEDRGAISDYHSGTLLGVLTPVDDFIREMRVADLYVTGAAQDAQRAAAAARLHDALEKRLR